LVKAVRKRLEWLIIEWPRGQDAPTRYWLSDLPRNYGLVRYAKAHWRIEIDYRELKDELGLDHYEGRFWMGWNHHVTLTMMAHAFLTLERERQLLLSTINLDRSLQDLWTELSHGYVLVVLIFNEEYQLQF